MVGAAVVGAIVAGAAVVGAGAAGAAGAAVVGVGVASSSSLPHAAATSAPTQMTAIPRRSLLFALIFIVAPLEIGGGIYPVTSLSWFIF